MIEIISSDQETFSIDAKVASSSSRFIASLLEDHDETDIKIPVELDSSVLVLAIEYMNHHRDEKAERIEKPMIKPFKSLVSKWDYDFISKVPDKELESVIMCANYLDIPNMLELVCANFVSRIKDKTPEEIREMFDIVNDLTPEEEQRIKEENKWIDEL